METSVLTADDDLATLVRQINVARWDEANDMSTYSVASLRAYLEREDTVFVACHDFNYGKSLLLGIASARVQVKPYADEHWLYVDEVDVCVDQREQGVGKHLMQTLFEIAKTRECSEVWLGTEVDNQAANALYQSLKPVEVMSFVGYTYKVER